MPQNKTRLSPGVADVRVDHICKAIETHLRFKFTPKFNMFEWSKSRQNSNIFNVSKIARTMEKENEPSAKNTEIC